MKKSLSFAWRCSSGARGILISFCLSLIALATTTATEPITLSLENKTRIPSFTINGKPARIHSQGLYVTDLHYFVTGRLETEPKRALFIRISRNNPSMVESVDITPTDLNPDPADHPGGFDFDGKTFWIPISPSKPNSHAVIVRFPHHPDERLDRYGAETAFTVNDHIGALAVDRDSQQLAGANWDTKIIYLWNLDGQITSRIPQQNLQRPDRKTILAVQDWKYVGNGQLLASGLDKNPSRAPQTPRALIEIIDPKSRVVIAQGRLPRPTGATHDVTNEGVALFEGNLYFLPGDVGIESVIYCYRWIQ
ncbi:MAG: DUF6454 family protein [Verrucomicrobia bacterium]|nr:DUF6454 family protein [Verrucomicrobiota bacterium]